MTKIEEALNWLCRLLIMSVPDKDFPRKASCALHYISTLLLEKTEGAIKNISNILEKAEGAIKNISNIRHHKLYNSI